MLKFNEGITVICKFCNFFDVYMIDIDEYRIELSDSFGMVIGTIDANELNSCEIISENHEFVPLKEIYTE